MSNPLFEQMNQTNLHRLQHDFEVFRRNFRGDPKAQVQEMLRNGTMTQAQFEELSAQANQIMQIFNGFNGAHR